MSRAVQGRGSSCDKAAVVIFDGLTFRTSEELKVYKALCAIESTMPEFRSFSIASNCALRVRGATFVVDLLVVHRTHTGVIEVDGSFHERKWSSDRSRDQLLEDSGIAFVHRIDVRDVGQPKELDKFLRRFVARLLESPVAA